MPSFKLDGKEVPFTKGDTIIRAAWREGVDVPHYCWHPGLSVAANCRMCLVEIKSARPMMMPVLKWDAGKNGWVPDTKPKLQPACQIEITEGMEVSTQSDEVKQAHKAVQEFLLLNHPVDCPICDQAGECKLQDYWLEHQSTPKRKRTEPVHKVKGVRFGPTIVYDAERCVMCTRCIRFCDEVVGDHVLDMRQRGNQNEIILAPGRQLDHKYSLMTEHVCPVGALTSRDFRFKARVWFLKSQPGVCVGCATGCNTHVDFDPRTDRVYRLRPRDNEAVNKFWMCDDGMMTYREIHEGRALVALAGRGSARDEITLEGGLELAAEAAKKAATKKAAVVLSARASTEDNAALVRFAKDVLKTERFYLAANGGWQGDKILRSSDNNPNRLGAEKAAGGKLKSLADLVSDAEHGEIDSVFALGHVAAESEEDLARLSRLDAFVCFASNVGVLTSTASLVVPVASWAETSGTFVNEKGQAQAFKRAVRAPGQIAPAWQTLGEVAKRAGAAWPFANLEDVRRAAGIDAQAQSAKNAGASA
jgi:NADH-quinone oxidoreductase subunit G